jgi:hypothetical protein
MCYIRSVRNFLDASHARLRHTAVNGYTPTGTCLIKTGTRLRTDIVLQGDTDSARAETRPLFRLSAKRAAHSSFSSSDSRRRRVATEMYALKALLRGFPSADA